MGSSNGSTHYLLFHTIHDVLRAEKILKKAGIDHELVPVPRNLSSDCGVCVKSHVPMDELLAHLNAVPADQCVCFDGKEWKKISRE